MAYAWMLRGRCLEPVWCAVSASTLHCAHPAHCVLVKAESRRARVIVQPFVLNHQGAHAPVAAIVMRMQRGRRGDLRCAVRPVYGRAVDRRIDPFALER